MTFLRTRRTSVNSNLPSLINEQSREGSNGYVILLRRLRSIWVYRVQDPNGGMMGFTFFGSRSKAIEKAVSLLPSAETSYRLILNGRDQGIQPRSKGGA